MDARRILGAVAALVTTLPGACQGGEHGTGAAVGGAVLVVVLRRPPLGGARQPRDHRLRRHGWAYRARGLRPRHRAAAAADGVRPARGDDHNNPSLVFFRERLYAFSAPHSGYSVPGATADSEVRYRIDAAGGAAATAAPTRTRPARRGLRARLHLPEPRRGRLAAVPVHARAVLGAVLHLDDRRPPLGRAAHDRPRAAVEPQDGGGSRGCARTRSTRKARATPC